MNLGRILVLNSICLGSIADSHKLSEIFFFVALIPDFMLSKTSSAPSLKSPAE